MNNPDKPHESELWWIIAVLEQPNRYDPDEKEAANKQAVTFLRRVRWLIRRLEEDSEAGLGLGLQVHIDDELNYLKTGEEF